MKLVVNFDTVDMGDEIVAVPVGDGSEKIHGVLKLNKSGAEILEYLKSGSSEEEIVEKLSKKYDNGRASLASDVHEAIESLEKAGLLV